ncbi:MAG: DNRLRE domain-containing protein [Microgenomates group bacterium]
MNDAATTPTVQSSSSFSTLKNKLRNPKTSAKFLIVGVLLLLSSAAFASMIYYVQQDNQSTGVGAEAASSNSYYVSPTGNDSNVGSISSPWKTITYAMNNPIVTAGDTVFLRGGVYNEGEILLNPGPQGENGTYLTLKRYLSEKPILRKTSLKIKGRDYIRVEGLTFDQIPVVPLGFESKFRPTKGVQIVDNTFDNNTNTPDVTFIRVSSWGGDDEPDLYLRTTDVLIEGNQLLDYSAPEDDKADALQVGGNVDYMMIKNNYLRDTTSIGITVAGRTWKNDEKFTKDSDDINPDQSDYFIVKGNIVENVNSNGIYLDAPGDNFIVEENIVFDSNKNGINLGGEKVTTSMGYENGIVRRNIMYNNYIDSNIGTRVDSKGDDATSCTQTISQKNIAFVHNSISRTSGSKFASRLYCVDGFYYKNNILSDATNSANNFMHQNPFGFVPFTSWIIDKNLYYSSSTPKQFEWAGTVHSNFTAYKAASGKDQNSFEANPQFVNPSGGDLSLSSNSPAIDAGVALTQTKSSGSGVSVSVNESTYFSDGMNLQPGDWIRVGSSAPVQVLDVNYASDVLTIDKSISWASGASVSYDYANSGPDIGADEFGYTPPSGGGGTTPSPSPSSSTVPAPTPSPTPSGTPAAQCGDLQCNSTETCSSCPTDCGSCPTPPPGGEELDIVVTPSSDSYTVARNPQATYGNITPLSIIGAPSGTKQGAYLQFSLAGIGADDEIVSASLQYFVNSVATVSGGRSGVPPAGSYQAWLTNSTAWTEGTLSYTTAPTLDTLISTLAMPATGSTVSVDVTEHIVTKKGQLVTFGLVDLTSGNTINISSKESSVPPKLVVKIQKESTPNPTPPPSPAPGGGGTVTLKPTHDTKTNSAQPIATYATQNLIHVQGTTQSVFMKFDLSAYAGKTITNATLRYTVGNSTDAATNNSYKVKRVLDNSWTEGSLSYINQPAFGGTLAEINGSGSSETETIDVTNYVANSVGSQVSFGLTDANGTDRLAIQSKENQVGPELVITYN